MKDVTTKFINADHLPIVIEPSRKDIDKQEAINLLSANRELVKKELLKYGGVLLRNFPLQNADDFNSVVKALNLGSYIDYIGGDSPRNKIKEGIYTSTEAPPSVKIPLHNELSFVKNYPKHIYFFCEIAPKERGETIIADARKIYEAVDPQVKKRFAEKKLRYVSCYFYKSKLMDFVNSIQKGHKSWIDVFETENKSDVERLCRENEFEFRWHQNDWLQISQMRPAVIPHPITNEMIWFNQAHLYDFNPKLLGLWRYIGAKALYCRKHMRLHEIFYGDHSSIHYRDLSHILDVLDAKTIRFPWQKGDLLVLDNVLAMHGRETFTGKRRILTAMTS